MLIRKLSLGAHRQKMGAPNMKYIITEEDEDRDVDALCPHRELQHRMGLTFH